MWIFIAVVLVPVAVLSVAGFLASERRGTAAYRRARLAAAMVMR